jgi:hypothetical protein
MNWPRRRPLGRVLGSEGGFGMIETVMAMAMFAVISAPLAP